MLRFTHKKTGKMLFGWQVPPAGRIPSEAMIDWLETATTTDWDGDETGVAVHNQWCRHAAPGDFVAIQEKSTELRVIYSYELPNFEVLGISAGEQNMNRFAASACE
jgi:hypothetical protein